MYKHPDTTASYSSEYPVAYLYCGGYDLAEISLQIYSASDERIRKVKVALNEPS
jgi:hypothetical protein